MRKKKFFQKSPQKIFPNVSWIETGSLIQWQLNNWEVEKFRVSFRLYKALGYQVGEKENLYGVTEALCQRLTLLEHSGWIRTAAIQDCSSPVRTSDVGSASGSNSSLENG